MTALKTTRTRRLALALRACACGIMLIALPARAIAPDQFGESWSWRMPPRMFGQLSQPERVQFERAESLIQKGQFESAAAEYDKFNLQYPKSPGRPHALLMQGFANHLAKQRNKAIEMYTELLDFYAESPEVAAAAVYLKGEAQAENGNTAQAITTWKQIAGNAEYIEQPVADLALDRLATYAQQQNDSKAAEKYWLQIVQAFAEAFVRPEAGAKLARQNLTDLYILQQRYPALESLFAIHGGDAKPPSPFDNVEAAYERALVVFPKMDKAAPAAFLTWFLRREEDYVASKKQGEFLQHALRFSVLSQNQDQFNRLLAKAQALAAETPPEDSAAANATVVEALTSATVAGWKIDGLWKTFSESLLGRAKSLPEPLQIKLYNAILSVMRLDITQGASTEFGDAVVARLAEIYSAQPNPDRDRNLATIVDRLKSARRFAQAHAMVGRMQTPPLAKWKEIEIYSEQKEFEKSAAACEELENMAEDEYATRAITERAHIYKDHLKRYEDAIKLFNIISDPPATTWQIVDCYELMGQPEKAVSACSEIEGFFEKDAPRAAFRKAQIWAGAKDDKKAIAACRAVLKKYPKDQASSQAHQMLERYGIATGGGVTDE